AMQQFRRCDGENAGAGAEVERAAEPMSPRQAVERQHAGSGRGVFAGSKRCRCVNPDADGAGRHTIAIMRAIDKEPADPQGRKSELVLGQPVTGRQLLLADLDKSAPRRSGSKSKP